MKIKPNPGDDGVDHQMWNVGILTITLLASYAGSKAKHELAKEKTFLINVREIYASASMGEQKLAVNTIMSLWGEKYVQYAVEYARLLSKKLTGEDFAETIGKTRKPTQKEIDEPKERLFTRPAKSLINKKIKPLGVKT